MSVRYPQAIAYSLPSGALQSRKPGAGHVLLAGRTSQWAQIYAPSRLQGMSNAAVQQNTLQVSGNQRWENTKRVGWVIRRGFERVVDVVKWALLVVAALFAFLPVPQTLRKGIENLFLRGPLKSCKKSSQKDPMVRTRIQEFDFNLGAFQAELSRSRLGFDPKKDNIRLHAWYIPGQAGKPSIIYSHGRGSTVSHHEGLLKACINRGYGVLIYDYPNFGRSQGKATESSLYKSGLAASLYAKNELGIPVWNQVLMGNSLGSAVAAHTMTHLQLLGEKPRALVLVSTFPSVPEAFTYNRNRFGPVAKLLNPNKISLKFSVEEPLGRNVDVPVLIMQGESDKRTPVSMIQAMLHRLRPENQAIIQEKPIQQLQHCLKDRDFQPIMEKTAQFLDTLPQPGIKPASGFSQSA